MMNHKRALAAAIILAWLPALIGVAYPAVWQWSQTASSNSSADPSINWREGQSPSSVNDSARAMMAALASYRDDISGQLSTTGSSTAYLVTTHQNLCAAPSTVPQDGQQLSVTVNVANGVGATLAADSCSAYPIQSAAGVGVPAATLILGSPYTLRFSLANNAWMLRDFFGSALTVPLGGMIPYTGITVPNSNFVFPAGQCLSTTTYASYWVFLGSPASGSCAGGQFRIIDLSGRVPAGLDTMPGFGPANRLTSSATGCGTPMTSVGAACSSTESFTLLTANLPPYTPAGSVSVITTPNNVLRGSNAGGLSFQAGASFPLDGIVLGTLAQGAVTSTGTLTGTAQGGTNSPIARVQPTIGLTYLLRVI